jgi:hypothetical protein
MRSYQILLATLMLGIAARSASFAQSTAAVADAARTAIPGAFPSPSLRSVMIRSVSAPAGSRVVELDFALREDSPLAVELIDAAGHRTVVDPAQQSYRRGEGHLSIALRNLPPGSYLVRISTPKGLAQERITIVR